MRPVLLPLEHDRIHEPTADQSNIALPIVCLATFSHKQHTSSYVNIPLEYDHSDIKVPHATAQPRQPPAASLHTSWPPAHLK